MLQRFQTICILILLVTQTSAAIASDWIEDDIPTAGSIFPAGSFATHGTATQSIPPFSTATQLQQAAATGAPMLHFAQAMDALELEIFAKRNTKDDVTKRLDLLEKSVFASGNLPELSDNMSRLLRLVDAVKISSQTITAVCEPIVARKTNPIFGNQHRGILSKTLHSPTFWLLVGATGVIVGAYFLAKSSATAPYPEQRYVNPDQHYVGGYMRNGRSVNGGMRTMPNGITTDNLLGR